MRFIPNKRYPNLKIEEASMEQEVSEMEIAA